MTIYCVCAHMDTYIYIWPTQSGFTSGAGTADALFLDRRLLETTWAAKGGRKLFLALDWAKAFDSISPSSLLIALSRFGLPRHFVEMIGAIYSSRRFFVRECGSTSGMHTQHFGISHGCPPSPYCVRDTNERADGGCEGETPRGTRQTA